jgi:signal transduction histidine kinase
MTNRRLTDEELIEELNTRLGENRKALHDMTVMNRKLVELNQRLEQSEGLKSNFLSNIRNEINNPLSAILGLAGQIAAGTGRDAPTVTGLARTIEAEAFDLDFQLRNIFAAADLEAGATELEVAAVDVASVTRDVLDSFRHRSTAKGLTISLAMAGLDDAAPLPFLTDADKLRLILANLLANAIEFTGAGGSVAVRLNCMAGDLIVSVEDSGCGLDPTEQQLIFDRFRQLESGPRKNHRGHGLGLSITRSLLDLLGGTITVAGEKGKGAVFTVTLPPPLGAEAVDLAAEDGNLFFFAEGMEAK